MNLRSLPSIRYSTLPIRKAEALSREALTLFQELRHESGQMDAHDQLGDALQDAGNLAGALQEYDAYQQTARRLFQRDPDNTDWQRGLSVSHSTVGGVYEAQGLYAEAEPLYKRFLAIVKKALGPEHPFVAIVLEKYADILRKKGRGADAVKLEGHAQKIHNKHVREKPEGLIEMSESGKSG